MSDQLNLEVVTPHRTVLIEDVDSVTLPGIEGELGILPEHIPLLTTLDTGIMSYSYSGKKQTIVSKLKGQWDIPLLFLQLHQNRPHCNF